MKKSANLLISIEKINIVKRINSFAYSIADRKEYVKNSQTTMILFMVYVLTRSKENKTGLNAYFLGKPVSQCTGISM